MRYLILSLLLVVQTSYAEKKIFLFNEEEQQLLKTLKYSRGPLNKNVDENIRKDIEKYFHSITMVMSKVDIERNEKMTALQELDKLDQDFLFNRILDRKLKQKWKHSPKK